MRWTVTHDPADVEDITKTCIYSGEKLPDFIRDEPELMPGLEFYLKAFWDLSTCRQMGMGLGPIPWLSIHEYGKLTCNTEESYEDFQFHIRQLDSAYLNWASEKNKVTTK